MFCPPEITGRCYPLGRLPLSNRRSPSITAKPRPSPTGRLTKIGRVDPSEAVADSDTFVTIKRAGELSGVAENRLRNLVRRGKLKYRGSTLDPLIALSDVKLVGNLGLDRPTAKPRRPAGSYKKQSKPTWNAVVQGNVLEVVSGLPAGSIQAIVTSPPFWGQRVYADERQVRWADGTKAPFGREEGPDGYVAHSLEILAALRRVVKPTGTIWWNVGDSYMTRSIARESSRDRIMHYSGDRHTTWSESPYRRYSAGHDYLKDKDLTLVPFLIAVGAQKLGFWVRSIIVWSKTHKVSGAEDDSGDGVRAHVPEVVGDRPVVGHEYLLMLTRSVRYDYYPDGSGIFTTLNGDRSPLNARTVWSFPPVYKGNTHSARFPGELPKRCILLGTKPRDIVFDPFAGEGTTLLEAKRLKRRYFGCDISPTYVKIAREQLARLERTLQEDKVKKGRRPGVRTLSPR